MDIYIEHLVRHKKGKGSIVATVAIVLIAIVLFVFFGMISLSGILGAFTGAGFLLMAGAVYFAFYAIKYLDIEYEYLLTNSELDVDKILGKSKRKRIITIDFREVECCASIDELESMKSGIKKTYDFRGPGYNKTYFILIDTEDRGRVCILFEPTEKMIEAARKFNPRKIKE